MNFKNRLYKISEDLKSHNHKPNDVFEDSVKDRLNKALTSYIDEIEKSYEYLHNRDDIRVMQKIIKRKD